MSRSRRPRRLQRRLKRHQVAVPFFAFHPRPWWEWAVLGGFWLAIAAVLAIGAWSLVQEDWRFRIETFLPASPAAVFRLVDDPARRLAWEPGVVAITPLVGDGRQPGDTRLVFFVREGRRWQEEERILDRRPHRLLVLERRGPLRDARIEIRISPMDDGPPHGNSGTGLRTRLVWHERVRYHAPMDRLFGWWRADRRRQRLERALATLSPAAPGVRENGERTVTGWADTPP